MVAPVLVLLLGAVEEPELARYRPRVEEVAADIDHDIDRASLDHLPAHDRLVPPGARRLRRHHGPGAAGLVQIAVEIGQPQIIRVRDLAGLVDAGQAERQALLFGFDLAGVHLIHVERRIGHHEIALAGQSVRVPVVGDRFVSGLDRTLLPAP
jgi:hypothetical protein